MVNYKRCSVEGCDKLAQAQGVCLSHGAVVKRYVCSIDGCDNLRQRGGFCKQTHMGDAVTKRYRTEYCSEGAMVQGGVSIHHQAYVYKPHSCTKQAKITALDFDEEDSDEEEEELIGALIYKFSRTAQLRAEQAQLQKGAKKEAATSDHAPLPPQVPTSATEGVEGAPPAISQLPLNTSATAKTLYNYWLQEEEERFLLGLRLYGWGQWKRIQTIVQTRSNKQIKSHAHNAKSEIKAKYGKGKSRPGRISSKVLAGLVVLSVMIAQLSETQLVHSLSN